MPVCICRNRSYSNSSNNNSNSIRWLYRKWWNRPIWTEQKKKSNQIVPSRDVDAKWHLYLARWRCDHKVCVDILFAKLLRNIQSQRSVVIVNVTLCQITQYRMGTIHFFELRLNENRRKKMIENRRPQRNRIKVLLYRMHLDCPDSCLDGIWALTFDRFSWFRRVLLSSPNLMSRTMCRRMCCRIGIGTKMIMSPNQYNGLPVCRVVHCYRIELCLFAHQFGFILTRNNYVRTHGHDTKTFLFVFLSWKSMGTTTMTWVILVHRHTIHKQTTFWDKRIYHLTNANTPTADC